MFVIDFFVSPDGNSPVAEYLDGLNAEQAAKVLWTLSAIKLIHPTPSVHLKKMVATDDLWEVRLIFAGNIFRLLGGDGWHGQTGLGPWLHQKDGEDPVAGNSNNRNPKENL